MTYHNFFEMELNPDWTKMALQRVGDVPGPASAEEELTETEISWYVTAGPLVSSRGRRR